MHLDLFVVRGVQKGLSEDHPLGSEFTNSEGKPVQETEVVVVKPWTDQHVSWIVKLAQVGWSRHTVFILWSNALASLEPPVWCVCVCAFVLRV